MNNEHVGSQMFPDAETTYLQLNLHIADRDVEGVRQWSSKHPCLNQMERRPLTVQNPVCLAAQLGEVEIFNLLVNHGFSPTSLDIGGPGYRRPAFQPIHLAAQKGHLDLVKKLVESYHADVNAEVKGTTVLHFAVTDRRAGIVDYLLDHGADPLWTSSRHHTVQIKCPLVTAIRFRYWDLVHIMINKLKIKKGFPLVSVLNNIFQADQRDIAYMLYDKYKSSGLTFNPVTEPDELSIHTLHFLLEVNDLSMYNEQTRMLEKFLHPIATSGPFVKLMFEAGCPLSCAMKSLDAKIDTSHKRLCPEEDDVVTYIRTRVLSPYTLKDICLYSTRRHLGRVTPSKVDLLPLPNSLKNLIRLDHLKHYTEMEKAAVVALPVEKVPR